MPSDTIFALATAQGRAGVAVVRISGPASTSAAGHLGVGHLVDRRMDLCRLKDPLDGRSIDTALVVWFQAPRSFTGEDVVELHLHGGRAVSALVLRRLADLPGLRSADPGEFTRRALLNDKVDLAQIEGLGDLLTAETEFQAKQAVDLMEGRLSNLAAQWRTALVKALAFLEATLDFSDEEIPPDLQDGVRKDLVSIKASLQGEYTLSENAERLRHGFEVALVGKPNVGKSTLLNFIADRGAAITSEFPGTTRDILEVRMELRGLPVTLLDMAGLHDTTDPIESKGITKARERLERVDLRIFLVERQSDLPGLGVRHSPGDLICLAKADLSGSRTGLSVSGITGEGVPALLDAIVGGLEYRATNIGAASHPRHQSALRQAIDALDRAEARLREGSDALELVSADIGESLRALDFLVGKVDVESVLDVIFSSFCVGK